MLDKWNPYTHVGSSSSCLFASQYSSTKSCFLIEVMTVGEEESLPSVHGALCRGLASAAQGLAGRAGRVA